LTNLPVTYVVAISAAWVLWDRVNIDQIWHRFFGNNLSLMYAVPAVLLTIIYLTLLFISRHKSKSRVFLVTENVLDIITTPITLFLIVCAGAAIITNISNSFSLENIMLLLAGFALCLVIASTFTSFADSASYILRGAEFTSFQTDIQISRLPQVLVLVLLLRF
jgi:hypothetical protein